VQGREEVAGGEGKIQHGGNRECKEKTADIPGWYWSIQKCLPLTAWTKQLVAVWLPSEGANFPVMVDGSTPAMLQLSEVCSVARPVVAALMFSMMSTSP